MKPTMTYTGELTVVTCWCGMAHAIPSDLYKLMERRRDDGEQQPDVYCPLGHNWILSGMGRAQRERERAERLEAQLVAVNDQLDAEQRSHAATKGQLTKARKRADRGVCQHCKRSFVDVAKHVSTCHPNALAT